MVQPLQHTPGFTPISPSIVQQDADPAMALEAQSKAKVGTPDPQAQPTAKTEADLKPSSVPLEQPEVDPAETTGSIDAPILQPDSSPPEAPEIVGIDSVLAALESDAEPDFEEVDGAEWAPPAMTSDDYQVPIPELEGYKSVLGEIMNPSDTTTEKARPAPEPKEFNPKDYSKVRYIDRAKGVSPKLLEVVKLAQNYLPEGVEMQIGHQGGKRTLEEQKRLKAAGFSKTLKSRHLHGSALDIQPIIGGKNKFASQDMKDWAPIRDAMKRAAKELGVKVEWGGDWKGSWDKPHWQIG